MKFHAFALAAALVVGGAAFAAPNDAVKAPAMPDATPSVKLKHHAVRHVAKKHHRAMTTANRHHMHNDVAFSKSEPNNTSRDARMDEALRKFRTSHS